MARMARPPKSRVSIGNTTPQKEADTDFKVTRSAHNATRRQQYKRAKRAQQIHAVKAAAADKSSDPAAKKEAVVRRGELYRTWKPRGVKKVGELERLVKAQQAEIEELRRATQGDGSVPTLAPVSTPRRAKGKGAVADVDSSPVKIQQQLMEDVVASSSAGDAELEVEQVVEETTTGGDLEMDGVEDTTVTNNVEAEVKYPTLPSVEAEEVAKDSDVQSKEASEEPAAVKKKSRKEVVRESSADTNADTPRNIRRSPRKRAAKRKSAGGS